MINLKVKVKLSNTYSNQKENIVDANREIKRADKTNKYYITEIIALKVK